MSIATFNEPAAHIDLFNALLARLNGADGLGGMSPARVACRRDLAPKQGGDYVLLDVTRTFGGNRRIGGGIAPSSWYATTTAVGTSVGNASALLRRSTLALVGYEMTVGAETSTGIDFNGSMESSIEEDEHDRSLWVGSRTFTFAF